MLGLRWQDFDWLRAEVRIERGVVAGRTDDVKMPSSRKRLPLDTAIVTALKSWKSQTPFPTDGDFVFARPFLLGKKPYHGCPVPHASPGGETCGTQLHRMAFASSQLSHVAG